MEVIWILFHFEAKPVSERATYPAGILFSQINIFARYSIGSNAQYITTMPKLCYVFHSAPPVINDIRYSITHYVKRGSLFRNSPELIKLCLSDFSV